MELYKALKDQGRLYPFEDDPRRFRLIKTGELAFTGAESRFLDKLLDQIGAVELLEALRYYDEKKGS